MHKASCYQLGWKGHGKAEARGKSVKYPIARTHQPTSNSNAGRINKDSDVGDMHRKLGEHLIDEGAGTNIRGSEDFGGAQVAAQEPAATFTDGPSTDSFFERRMTICKPSLVADTAQAIADFATSAVCTCKDLAMDY